jgi:decaprenylphospho-beta-D-ribofuranose 2-oxidase
MTRSGVLLYPRKQLDTGWTDLAAAILHCFLSGDARSRQTAVENSLAPGQAVLLTFSVRTGFDLLLQALQLPRGSEIIMSALTIREMADIASSHGLVPIPLDLDLATLAPEASALESAVSPRSRALVVAHLFGSRIPMDPLIAIAKRHGLFVIEDCAQAFTGPNYTGHALTDAAMFSFGPIKTATALAGALIRVKDPQHLQAMRSIQEGYPAQKTAEYLHSLLTHVVVKLVTIPFLYGLFYRTCVLLEKDFEQVINAVRNLPEGEEDLSEIRKQPAAPLVALLARRLRTFDSARLLRRMEIGREFANFLPPGLSCPGHAADFHSYWVFPVLVNAPEQFAAALRSYGFDATTAGSALSVIEPPPLSGVPAAARLRDAYRKLLYLPVYPEVPARARERLYRAVCKIQSETPHLRLTDARRVYSAQVRHLVSPRTVSDIRDALEHAQKHDLPICLMGARHNLGGHAFAEHAVALDMRRFQRVVSLDVQRKEITVESGITWEKIQEKVNPAGLAVKAMQSDNIFTVGGSMSSNAHGRDIHCSTLIESVLGFRLMRGDGSIVSVSRLENPELFRLVIGGYGLFGIILEVDLALTENCVYRQSSEIISLGALPEYFERQVRIDRDAELFLARPSIARGRFLDETIVTTWRKTSKLHDAVFQLDHERNVRRDRWLFGLSRKFASGKTLRWYVEKQIALDPPHQGLVSRNNAMRPPVSAVKMFEYQSPTDTDAIQEFFVPISRFLGFVDAARSLFRESHTNLLGMTIRYLKPDRESFLSYAPREDAFAVITYINESVSPEGRKEAWALIRTLTNLAAQNGGTFYLTYARDVEIDDLRRAYPDVDAFFQKKNRLDPEHRFTSRFFEMYRQRSLAQKSGVA